MTQRSFPFPAGDGSQANLADWDLMARNFCTSGVIRGKLLEYQVFADSTGMQVKVRSGHAFVDGHGAISDVQETLAIAAADGTNPRIDRVVLRLDRSANEVELAVLTGTAAVTPAAPALARSDTGVWELSLARIAVAAGVSTIAAGNVTDERMYNLPPVDTVVGGVITTTSTTIVDMTGMVVTRYFRPGDLTAMVAGAVGNTANANGIQWHGKLDSGSDVLIGWFDPGAINDTAPLSGHAVFQNVAEGEHIVKLRWNVVTSGTGAANTPRLTVVNHPSS